MADSNRVSFISLGCPKALVDSELVVTQLEGAGYEIVPGDEPAEVVVVNTCGFIDAARDESYETIQQCLDDAKKVVVTGCLGTEAAPLKSRFPQVEFVGGPADVATVLAGVQHYVPQADPVPDLQIKSLQSGDDMWAHAGQRLRLTPEHYAYLKISEGCNHKCSFCIIPQMRGKLRSRPINSVLAEAQALVEQGVQELLVVAQDLSAYGVDIKYAQSDWNQRMLEARLDTLCQELGDIAPWVRLHYVYPYPSVDHLIPLMAEGKILPYLDVPLQHASPKVLKAMRRPAAAEKALQRIKTWRQICPELCIRSTFIVGFPGETDEDVGMLLDFLEEAQLDRVGCFTYSPVEGARANALADHVDQAEQLDRAERVYETQATISASRLQTRVGKTLRVLVDSVDNNQLVGRSQYDAPEIDGQVFVALSQADAGMSVKEGDFVWASITHSDDHDLFGEIVGQGVSLG